MGWWKNGMPSQTTKLRQLAQSVYAAQRKLIKCAEEAEAQGWPEDNALREAARRVGVFRLAVDSLADEHRDPRGRHRRSEIGESESR